MRAIDREQTPGLWIPAALGLATCLVLFGLLGVSPGGAGGGGLLARLFRGADGDPSGMERGPDDRRRAAERARAERTAGERGAEAGAPGFTRVGSGAAAEQRRTRRAAEKHRRGLLARAARAAAARERGAEDPEDRWSFDDDDVVEDTEWDDDDSADGDDDDSAEGDDDDSARGDDDDSAGGDDDDSAEGDDDDSAEPTDDFLDRTYCLDWDSAHIAAPPGITQLLELTGAAMEDYSVLAMPTDVDFDTGEIFFLGAPGNIGSCTQDTAFPSVDMPDGGGAGVYVEPDFEVATSFFRLPVTDPPLTIYEFRLTGSFTEDSTGILDSTLYGRLDVTPWSELTCEFDGWFCYPCGAGLRRTCVDLLVQGADWPETSESTGLVRVTGR